LALVLAWKGSCPVSSWYITTPRSRCRCGGRGLFADLLGRHVGRRAEAGILGGFAGGEDGRAEIGDLDGGRRREQDVGRLDVPVGDALQVGVVEGPRALEDDLDQALEGQQVVRLGEGSRVPPGRIPSP
jgi:hypothetical protein